VIRDLTAEEVEKHDIYSPTFVEARNRLGLFRLLDRNYKAWRDYLRSLLNAEYGSVIGRWAIAARYLLPAHPIRHV
jgi:hypothetical protein